MGNRAWGVTDGWPEPVKTPTYRVECRWSQVDLKLDDHWFGGAVTKGKQVSSGNWNYTSDSLANVMEFCESLQDGEIDGLITSYEMEVFRLGMPLFLYSGGIWRSVGDDYLDPYVDDSIQESFLYEALDIDPTLALTNF